MHSSTAATSRSLRVRRALGRIGALVAVPAVVALSVVVGSAAPASAAATLTAGPQVTGYPGLRPVVMASSPNSPYLFVGTPSGIAVVRESTNSYLQMVANDTTSPTGLALSPNGAVLAATDANGGVTQIDTSTLTAATTQPVIMNEALGGVVYSSSSGLRYVLDTSAESVIEISPEGAYNREISIDHAPSGIAISPDGRTIYVTSAADGIVSAVDVGSMAVTRTVAVGSGANDIAVSPNGQMVAVAAATPGTISLLSPALTPTLSFSTTGAPRGPQWSADSSTLFFALPSQNSLVSYDPVTTRTSTVSALMSGSGPTALALSQDGRTLYSGNVQNSSIGTWNVQSAPTVTGISPSTGTTSGGTAVTITGTNFGAGASVSFGGTASSNVTVNSSTSITATAPAHAAGTVDVIVTLAGSTSATSSADHYTYLDAAKVDSIAPTSGPTAGGTSVVITGSGFLGTTGANGVTFDRTNAASYVVNSDTQITAVTPALPAGDHITVVNAPGGGSTPLPSTQFTAVAAPTVTAISPTSGPASGGRTVTITGTGFTGATAVKFGTAAATNVTVASNTQITATAPSLPAGPVDVTVTAPGGTSATSANDRFTAIAAPTITSIAPNSGPTAGGTSVTITGAALSNASVTFNGTSGTLTSNTATAITVRTPANAAGTVDVRVTTPGGSSAQTTSDQFTYVAAPTATSISPSAGPTAGGTTVTVTGSGFLVGSTTATVGGTTASSVVVSSSTSLTFTTPAHTAGIVDVAVTTPGGTATLRNAYTVESAPTVTGVSPSSGSAAGGTTVVVTGTNLTDAGSVTFGGTAGTSVTRISATQLTVVAPAHAAGRAHRDVRGPGGTGTLIGGYVYVAVPTVTAINANSGPTTGGRTVTITGTGLSTVTDVTIGGTSATSVVVVSDTTLSAVAPAGTLGAADVVVSTSGGTATLVRGYTYYTTPGAPTIGAATTGDGTVTVRWTAPASDGGSSIDGYDVQTSTDGTTWRSATLADGTETQATKAGLVNGTTYEFRVVAMNAAGAGSPSGAVTATPSTTPGVPTDLTATPGDGTVALGWTAPTDDGGAAVTYVLERSTNGTDWTTIASPSGTSATDTGLTNGTTYSYRVTAHNVAGDGTPTAAVTATPRTSATAPTAVTVTPGNGSVTVSWTAPSSNGGAAITGYTVQTSTDGGTTWTTAATPTGTTATITGLRNGTSYGIRVVAENAAGDGTPSDVVTIAPRTISGTPGALVGTVGDGRVTLSWSAPTDDGGAPVDGYVLQESTDGTTWTAIAASVAPALGPQTATITGTTATVTGLTDGTAYSFRVLAQNAAGTSAPSTAVTLTPTFTVTPVATSGGTPLSATTVKPGSRFAIRLASLPVGAAVTLTLDSDPTVLATGTVGADGTVEVDGAFPEGLADGAHALVTTVTFNGLTESTTTALTVAAAAVVTPPATPTPTASATSVTTADPGTTALAFTGTEGLGAALAAGLALLLAGLGVRIARRRRRA